MSECNVGDLQRVSATNITNAAGAVTDPTTLSLEVKKPGADLITYDYPDDPIIVKDSVGNYHADLDLDTVGRWRYAWVGGGAAQFAEGGQFRVFARPTG